MVLAKSELQVRRHPLAMASLLGGPLQKIPLTITLIITMLARASGRGHVRGKQQL